MRHVFIFLLIISIIVACSQKPVDKAKQFIEAGMYGDAIPLLEEEIQKNPKNTEAHYLLGVAFLNVGEEGGASQSFDRAIKLDQKKYTPKITEAYYKTGLSFLNQDTPVGVRRGLRYLDQTLDAEASLKSEISKAYRDRGVALAKNDKSLSHELLVKALELDPNLKRDNDFYYALYIDDVRDTDLQNKGCEDFLSLFPESNHIEDVLYLMGNYQYSVADYQKAKLYFSQLGDRYPDNELGKKAKVMVDTITKMEQEIGQAELERARKIKQIEIEKARQLKQMEVEKAENQKQLEIEQKQIAQDAQLREQQDKLVEAQARALFEGKWLVSYVYGGKNKVGKFIISVSGNILTGALDTGFTYAVMENSCSFSGTCDGNSFSVRRTCSGWNSGESQTWSGSVDSQNKMRGSFTWKGKSYSFTGTKEK